MKAPPRRNHSYCRCSFKGILNCNSERITPTNQPPFTDTTMSLNSIQRKQGEVHKEVRTIKNEKSTNIIKSEEVRTKIKIKRKEENKFPVVKFRRGAKIALSTFELSVSD